MEQIRLPCHSSGTNGADGAWSKTSHTASSRGAPAVMARYAARISSARSNGQAISPP
jgi:hypothetical protein